MLCKSYIYAKKCLQRLYRPEIVSEYNRLRMATAPQVRSPQRRCPIFNSFGPEDSRLRAKRRRGLVHATLLYVMIQIEPATMVTRMNRPSSSTIRFQRGFFSSFRCMK